MKYKFMMVWLGVWIFSVCLGAQVALAEKEGFLESSTDAASPLEEMLPPEAVYEGTQVLHKILSKQENLHLLSGYYFGNPRLWKKIYEENRDVIKNANSLPVGKTIRIQVGENWRPKFSYAEWFQLATRNGEWQPGTWQRAKPVSAPAQPPASSETSGEPSVSVVPPQLKEPKSESRSSATPTPATAAESTEEESSAEPSSEEESSEEGSSEEESAAEPAL